MLLVCVIGLLDYLTGFEVSFSIFYLIPIIWITWKESPYSGQWIALISAMVWLLADLLSGHQFSHVLIPFWNALMRLGVFMLVSVIIHKLRVALEYQTSLAQMDHLTRVANLRYFVDSVQRELERSKRYGHPLTLVYIDLDNFKAVNDSLGHQQGDRLLQRVAETIKKSIRDTDVAGRLGGDEFAILLPETEELAAREVLQRLQKELSETMAADGWKVTFSIGSVTFFEIPSSVNEAIKRADELMYEVKRSGKNNIRFYSVGGPVSP